MAITLGALRSYCRRVAFKNRSDAQASEAFNDAINSALQRLFAEATWDVGLRERKILLGLEETGADLVLTQGSRAISRVGGNFATKWLTERWELFVDALETQTTLELSAIGGLGPDDPLLVAAAAATLRDGDDWARASVVAPGASFAFVRTRYEIPSIKELERVEDVEFQLPLTLFPKPESFDRMKREVPVERRDRPRFATFRAGFLEVWPHPGTDYLRLAVTYRTNFTPVSSGDADATIVDWDDRYLALLQRAIVTEAARMQGEGSPIPEASAEFAYRSMLKIEAETAQKPTAAGPMTTRTRTWRGGGWRGSDFVGQVLP